MHMMRTAIIHDWLTGMRGGEKVLEALCELYPSAPIFTLLHVPGSVSSLLETRRIRTSILQYAPLVKHIYRNYLPFFPRAIEKFDLSGFDLVISSSHCVAKGVIPSPGATHICYCHTPMRYIWSHYEDYFGNHRTGWFRRKVMSVLREHLCEWDVAGNQRVDQFVVNSRAVGERVRKFYGRESVVVYPPVDVHFFTPSGEPREPFFLIVSALVPYKRIEVALEAFRRLKIQLKIVGTGPDYKRLSRMSGENVHFLGRVDSATLLHLYRTAQALVLPGEEDFGINVVEALACGCPVIAYSQGGALETVVECETGMFFNDLTADSLAEAVDKFPAISFNKALMRETARGFSPERFKSEFQKVVNEAVSVR